jgi:hypothetical protein
MFRMLRFAPLVIPASQILFAVWFLNPALRNALNGTTVRLVTDCALICFGGIAVAFVVVGATVAHCDWNQRTRQQAECDTNVRAQSKAQASADEEAFRALTPQSPLIEWLGFTEYSHAEQYRRAARDLIVRRPNLVEDLSTAIASTNTEVSTKLLNLVGELPTPPVQVADAVRGRAQLVVQIAQAIDPAAANSREMLYAKAHGIAAGVQAAAFGLQRAGVYLTPELQAMADACQDREKTAPRDIADSCERIIKLLSDKRLGI